MAGEQVAVPRSRVHLLPESGVVDDHVDRAEFVANPVGGGVEGRTVGHVDRDDGHLALGDGVQLVLAAGGDRHSGAASYELGGERGADAAGCSDDPDRSPGEAVLVGHFRLLLVSRGMGG